MIADSSIPWCLGSSLHAAYSPRSNRKVLKSSLCENYAVGFAMSSSLQDRVVCQDRSPSKHLCSSIPPPPTIFPSSLQLKFNHFFFLLATMQISCLLILKGSTENVDHPIRPSSKLQQAKCCKPLNTTNNQGEHLLPFIVTPFDNLQMVI